MYFKNLLLLLILFLSNSILAQNYRTYDTADKSKNEAPFKHVFELSGIVLPIANNYGFNGYNDDDEIKSQDKYSSGDTDFSTGYGLNIEYKYAFYYANADTAKTKIGVFFTGILFYKLTNSIFSVDLNNDFNFKDTEKFDDYSGEYNIITETYGFGLGVNLFIGSNKSGNNYCCLNNNPAAILYFEYLAGYAIPSNDSFVIQNSGEKKLSENDRYTFYNTYDFAMKGGIKLGLSRNIYLDLFDGFGYSGCFLKYSLNNGKNQKIFGTYMILGFGLTIVI